MALKETTNPAFSFNTNTALGEERYREIQKELSNLTESQKSESDITESYLSGLMTPEAFEKWQRGKKKDKTKINPLSTPYAGEVAKVANPNVDFNKGPGGESIEGPSSPAVKPEGEGLDFGAGAITALQQAPSIIENFSGKPTTGGEANARVANQALSFAQIGLSVGGPWGAAIGGVVGAGAGLISNSGWYDEVLASNDKAVMESLKEDKQDRMRDYIRNKTSDQLEAEGKAYARALGYSGRTLTT